MIPLLDIWAEHECRASCGVPLRCLLTLEIEIRVAQANERHHTIRVDEKSDATPICGLVLSPRCVVFSVVVQKSKIFLA